MLIVIIMIMISMTGYCLLSVADHRIDLMNKEKTKVGTILDAIFVGIINIVLTFMLVLTILLY